MHLLRHKKIYRNHKYAHISLLVFLLGCGREVGWLGKGLIKKVRGEWAKIILTFFHMIGN